MKNKIVLFDFDGVIVDSFSLCFKIVDSREYITEDEYRQRFEGNVFDAVRKFKKPGTTMEGFAEHYRPEIMKCSPIPHIAEAIKKLSQKYTLIIVSSTDTEPIDTFLRQAGLRECFTEILGADVDRSKVNKINRVLKDYKITTADTVFVTDTLGDMKEAENCGVRCIGVTGGFNDEVTLKKGSPLALVNSGEELVEIVNTYLKV